MNGLLQQTRAFPDFETPMAMDYRLEYVNQNLGLVRLV